jgi:hypothetical protein
MGTLYLSSFFQWQRPNVQILCLTACEPVSMTVSTLRCGGDITTIRSENQYRGRPLTFNALFLLRGSYCETLPLLPLPNT